MVVSKSSDFLLLPLWPFLLVLKIEKDEYYYYHR